MKDADFKEVFGMSESDFDEMVDLGMNDNLSDEFKDRVAHNRQTSLDYQGSIFEWAVRGLSEEDWNRILGKKVEE